MFVDLVDLGIYSCIVLKFVIDIVGSSIFTAQNCK